MDILGTVGITTGPITIPELIEEPIEEMDIQEDEKIELRYSFYI